MAPPRSRPLRLVVVARTMFLFLQVAAAVLVVVVSGWAPPPSASTTTNREGRVGPNSAVSTSCQQHRPQPTRRLRLGLLVRTQADSLHQSTTTSSRLGSSSSSSSIGGDDDPKGDSTPVLAIHSSTTTTTTAPWNNHTILHAAAAVLPSDANASASGSGGGALSRTVDELALSLGGRGRARLAWDCYCLGVDPALLSLLDDDNDIRRLLPSARRTQLPLGKEALAQLSQLHQQHCHGVSSVENGVATLVHHQTSRDGTTKLLLQLHDSTMVETVIIPWNDNRSTLCISSQVGCRQACQFCATGKMGRVRSLSTDEILSQMFFARQWCRLHPQLLPPVSNVVFMGMGEPSDNAAAVVQATRQLTARSLFQLSARKVTVSTVAPTPDAFDLFRDAPCVLAWSVHAARDELRRQLVPTTRYTMHELQQGLIRTLQHRPRQLRTTMLEVTLLDHINDSVREADELAVLALEIVAAVPECKLMVNLIPYNDIYGPNNDNNNINNGNNIFRFRPPTPERVRQFQQRLWDAGVYAHVRVTRGDDAHAACGQLVTAKTVAASSSRTPSNKSLPTPFAPTA